MPVSQRPGCFGWWDGDEVEFREYDEIVDRIRCRLRELTRAGCDEPDCLVLASRVDVALEAALALITRGCPPGLALEILV